MRRFADLSIRYVGASSIVGMFVMPLLLLFGFLSLQTIDRLASMRPLELGGAIFATVIGTGLILAALHMAAERIHKGSGPK